MEKNISIPEEVVELCYQYAKSIKGRMDKTLPSVKTNENDLANLQTIQFEAEQIEHYLGKKLYPDLYRRKKIKL